MITYVTNPKLTVADVLPLYDSVGWSNYTSDPERLQAGLDGTTFILAAYADEQLVGLLRAVGDGATILFIQDILVLPRYQRQGIGRRLLEDTLQAHAAVYQCHLLTDRTSKTQAFYEELDFISVEKLECMAYTYWKK